MFCRQCGIKIPDDSKFCFSCGMPADVNQQAAHVNSSPAAASRYGNKNEPVDISGDSKNRRSISENTKLLLLVIGTILFITILYLIQSGLVTILSMLIILGSFGIIYSWIGGASNTRYKFKGMKPIEPTRFQDNLGFNLYLIALIVFAIIHMATR